MVPSVLVLIVTDEKVVGGPASAGSVGSPFIHLGWSHSPVRVDVTVEEIRACIKNPRAPHACCTSARVSVRLLP